jgi:protein phosphatase
VGVRRSHNQDNHAVQLAGDPEQWLQRGHLFLVADGMGAHAVGEKASEQAASVIPHTYQKYAPQGPAAALRKAFVEANASIHAFGQQNREFEGTGTTSTALLLRSEGAWISHVGDSRVYRIRSGVIEQLSYDHSLVWEYARIKQIDPDKVQDIPSNVIHRCLGPEPLVQIDIEGPHPVSGGDIFLLCSDGLSGQVTDHEMGAVASTLPPAEACRFLVDLANLRGGPDNITVIIVRLGGNPDANGLTPDPVLPNRPRWPRVPWWAATLLMGTALAGGAATLNYYGLPGDVFTFLLGAVAIVAGLVGLFLHYQQEQRRLLAESDLPPPRIHRRASCRIDPTLVDRLALALTAVHKHAEEKKWEADWKLYEEHRSAAEVLLKQGDLSGAFREFCRAMLPLTRALQKQRGKEETFQPVWDKTL